MKSHRLCCNRSVQLQFTCSRQKEKWRQQPRTVTIIITFGLWKQAEEEHWADISCSFTFPLVPNILKPLGNGNRHLLHHISTTTCPPGSHNCPWDTKSFDVRNRKRCFARRTQKYMLDWTRRPGCLLFCVSFLLFSLTVIQKHARCDEAVANIGPQPIRRLIQFSPLYTVKINHFSFAPSLFRSCPLMCCTCPVFYTVIYYILTIYLTIHKRAQAMPTRHIGPSGHN